MELLLNARESLLRALSSPRAVATEAAPSLPQSVAAQLAVSFEQWRGGNSGHTSCIFRPHLLARVLKTALPGSVNLRSTYFFGLLRDLHFPAVATTAEGKCSGLWADPRRPQRLLPPSLQARRGSCRFFHAAWASGWWDPCFIEATDAKDLHDPSTEQFGSKNCIPSGSNNPPQVHEQNSQASSSSEITRQTRAHKQHNSQCAATFSSASRFHIFGPHGPADSGLNLPARAFERKRRSRLMVIGPTSNQTLKQLWRAFFTVCVDKYEKVSPEEQAIFTAWNRPKPVGAPRLSF